MNSSELLARRMAQNIICSQKLCTEGPTGPTGPVAQMTNTYGSFYSTETQQIGVFSPTKFSYNVTALAENITLFPPSKIQVDRNGVYEIWYSLELTCGGISPSPVQTHIWIRKNGVDATETNRRVTVDCSGSDPYHIPATPYIFNLQKGDYLEVLAQADLSGVEARAISGGPIGPDIPSIIVGIKQIAVDIGDSGPTGATGPPGALSFFSMFLRYKTDGSGTLDQVYIPPGLFNVASGLSGGGTFTSNQPDLIFFGDTNITMTNMTFNQLSLASGTSWQGSAAFQYWRSISAVNFTAGRILITQPANNSFTINALTTTNTGAFPDPVYSPATFGTAVGYHVVLNLLFL